ncbi:hypothetical protein [Phormidesmis priestleyi]|nr:hypothetical protein [Phormidesmis priestleyi]
MTTQPHDQFTKELLGELLAPFGEVEPDLAIKGLEFARFLDSDYFHCW